MEAREKALVLMFEENIPQIAVRSSNCPQRLFSEVVSGVSEVLLGAVRKGVWDLWKIRDDGQFCSAFSWALRYSKSVARGKIRVALEDEAKFPLLARPLDEMLANASTENVYEPIFDRQGVLAADGGKRVAAVLKSLNFSRMRGARRTQTKGMALALLFGLPTPKRILDPLERERLANKMPTSTCVSRSAYDALHGEPSQTAHLWEGFSSNEISTLLRLPAEDIGSIAALAFGDWPRPKAREIQKVKAEVSKWFNNRVDCERATSFIDTHVGAQCEPICPYTHVASGQPDLEDLRRASAEARGRWEKEALGLPTTSVRAIHTLVREAAPMPGREFLWKACSQKRVRSVKDEKY